MSHLRLTPEQFDAKQRGKTLNVPEADILKSVIRFLKIHPSVAWAERMNVGAQAIDGRFVRYGFPGCSDIIGQIMDGRFLAIECKATRGRVTAAQEAFLGAVAKAGGVALVARSVEDVAGVLDRMLKRG